MRLRDLKFDTTEDAAHSLAKIAIAILDGHVTVDITNNSEAPKWLRIEVYDIREGRG
jgi:hypothetical protein